MSHTSMQSESETPSPSVSLRPWRRLAILFLVLLPGAAFIMLYAWLYAHELTIARNSFHPVWDAGKEWTKIPLKCAARAIMPATVITLIILALSISAMSACMPKRSIQSGKLLLIAVAQFGLTYMIAGVGISLGEQLNNELRKLPATVSSFPGTPVSRQ